MNINTRNLSFVNFNNEEMNWVKFNGVTIYESWKELIKNGVPPLTIYSKGEDLIDYKLYGNTVQNGTPTLEVPAEIETVGEKTKNLFNGKWKNGRWSTSTGDPTSDKTSIQFESSIVLEPNTTYYVTIPSGKSFYGCLRDINENEYYSIGLKSKSFFFNTQEDLYVFSMFQYGDTTIPENIQVEKGSTQTEYEPYGCRIPIKVTNGTEEITTDIYLSEPLRKLGDYEDYIDFTNKKVIRNVAYQLLDGNESYTDRTSSGGLVNCKFFQLTLPYTILNTTGLSNRFSIINNGLSDVTHLRYYTGNTYLGVIIEHPDVVDTASFKLWLANNNVDVYYIMKTPIEEDIELPNIPTHKGTTILEVDTTTQPSNLEVVYKGKEVK